MVGGVGVAPFSDRRAARARLHTGVGEWPHEWSEIEFIDALCQRWGQPPSVVLGEDALFISRLNWYLSLRAEHEGRADSTLRGRNDEADMMPTGIPMESL